MLSSLEKSGSTRTVLTRTNPTPPHSKHRPIVLRQFLRDDLKARVLVQPVLPHDAQRASYFMAMRSRTHASLAGSHVASSSVDGRRRRTDAHMYPWGVEIGSGRQRDFFPSRGLGSGALDARTRSQSVHDAHGTPTGARAKRDNCELRWDAREDEACTALGGAWRHTTLACMALFTHEIFVGADEARSKGTRRSSEAQRIPSDLRPAKTTRYTA